jgi:hypothetical protein
MKRTTTFVLALALALLTTGLGYAQETESGGSGPRVQKIQEVERGFWIRSAFGFSMAVTDLFGGKGSESPIWPPGPGIGVEIGYDLGQVASIHLAAYGLQVSGTRSTTRADVSNDAGVMLAMIGGRFNLMTTKRLGWFVKVGAGYMFAAPELARLDQGAVIHVGTGVEYATQLRHFFVGLEAVASYLPAIGGFSAIVTPTLKYAF